MLQRPNRAFGADGDACASMHGHWPPLMLSAAIGTAMRERIPGSRTPSPRRSYLDAASSGSTYETESSKGENMV